MFFFNLYGLIWSRGNDSFVITFIQGGGGLSLNQVSRAMTIFCPGVCSRPGIEAGKGARLGQSLMTTCFFYDLLGQN